MELDGGDRDGRMKREVREVISNEWATGLLFSPTPLKLFGSYIFSARFLAGLVEHRCMCGVILVFATSSGHIQEACD